MSARVGGSAAYPAARVVASLGCIIALLLTMVPAVSESQVLADFSDPREIAAWRALHDTVMGGRSDGALVAGEDGAALFTGTISLENNGGFASVRGPIRRYPLQGCHGVTIEVRGDPRRFQLRFRTDDRFDGVAWRAFFEPAADEWQRISLPFQVFVPVFRGRVLGPEGQLEPLRITRLGLMLADGKAGPYRLEIRRISADCS
jgi:monofunctional biosynthetic peptidoglycan transglycosylase